MILRRGAEAEYLLLWAQEHKCPWERLVPGRVILAAPAGDIFSASWLPMYSPANRKFILLLELVTAEAVQPLALFFTLAQAKRLLSKPQLRISFPDQDLILDAQPLQEFLSLVSFLEEVKDGREGFGAA